MKILPTLSMLSNNLKNLLNYFAAKNAYAATAATKASGGGWKSDLISFALLIGIVAIFYLLIILPQQKRTKEHRRMIESLKIGDEVLTIGGIFGIITGIADQVFTLEIAKDVKIKITKSAIATKTAKQ